jgi:hypothetical protein
MSKLIELAERCDAANIEGCERALLMEAFDLVVKPSGDALMSLAISRFHQLLLMGAFLEAVMMLMPETNDDRAVFWRLGNDGEGGNPGDFKAEILIASTFAAKEFPAVAKTAPLALCAAALRARASQEAK